MRSNIKDLRGRRFGRLRVLLFAGIFNRHAYWCCKCACLDTCRDCHGAGCSKKVQGTDLITGRQKSCGCSRTDSETKRNAALRIPKTVRLARSKAAVTAKCSKPQLPAYKLTLERAADLIGVSRERVVALCDMHVLRSTWRAGERRVSATDVTEYIAMQAGEPQRCPVDPAE